MRVHGTLTSWNDERGFGFITRDQSDEKVFVHISAFPQDGVRPRLGEVVSFEIDSAGNGKTRAIRIQRAANPARRDKAVLPASRVRDGRLRSVFVAMITLAPVAAGVALYVPRSHKYSAPEPARKTIMPPPASLAESFHCDGRTRCKEMTSCAEATWFLQNCPNVKMDGDGDGVPCEQQWCSQ